jgi:hypothetical protein
MVERVTPSSRASVRLPAVEDWMEARVLGVVVAFAWRFNVIGSPSPEIDGAQSALFERGTEYSSWELYNHQGPDT